jgi:Immunity protein 63
MATPAGIKQRIEQLAQQINAPANALPTYDLSRRDGTPHIEYADSFYYYISFDRNITALNKKTADIEELLYWVFQDVTFHMSSRYGSAHRDSETDSRKVLFGHQLELLGALNPRWKERREQEIVEMLKAHPYVDNAGKRID